MLPLLTHFSLLWVVETLDWFLGIYYLHHDSVVTKKTVASLILDSRDERLTVVTYMTVGPLHACSFFNVQFKI